MSTINVGRVILGGLVTGLVVNIGETVFNLAVVSADMEAAQRAHNLPPVEGGAIGGFVILTFALGLLTVWLYAAIRPRFGPGPRTAALTALVVWFCAYLHQGAALTLMGIVPAKLTTIGLVWGFVEIVIASIAGAAVYKE